MAVVFFLIGTSLPYLFLFIGYFFFSDFSPALGSVRCLSFGSAFFLQYSLVTPPIRLAGMFKTVSSDSTHSNMKDKSSPNEDSVTSEMLEVLKSRTLGPL